MSSTNQALGPKEPPAPPNCVMVQPYRRRSAPGVGLVASALPMSYPAALHVTARPAPAPGAVTVVFVHGVAGPGGQLPAGDAAAARAGHARLRPPGLPGLPGRRGGGPGRPRAGSPLDCGRRRAPRGGGPVVAIGHSLGGDVVVGAALAEPGAFDAIGAYEPPMPWLGFRRDRPGEARAWPAMADDPGEEAERFFTPDGGPGGLVPPHRGGPGGAPRRRSGAGGRPAQLAGRGPALRRHRARRAVRVRHGRAGRRSRTTAPRVQWLGAHVPDAAVYEITGAPTARTCRTPITSPR